MRNRPNIVYIINLENCKEYILWYIFQTGRFASFTSSSASIKSSDVIFDAHHSKILSLLFVRLLIYICDLNFFAKHLANGFHTKLFWIKSKFIFETSTKMGKYYAIINIFWYEICWTLIWYPNIEEHCRNTKFKISKLCNFINNYVYCVQYFVYIDFFSFLFLSL